VDPVDLDVDELEGVEPDREVDVVLDETLWASWGVEV